MLLSRFFPFLFSFFFSTSRAIIEAFRSRNARTSFWGENNDGDKETCLASKRGGGGREQAAEADRSFKNARYSYVRVKTQRCSRELVQIILGSAARFIHDRAENENWKALRSVVPPVFRSDFKTCVRPIYAAREYTYIFLECSQSWQ